MAARMNDKSKLMVRMGDLTSEPKRMLPPILGYENRQIVSLEEAVKPIIPFVPSVEQMVWTVKQNREQPQGQLSSDESASIMLYTLEWSPRESSLYFIFNQALRSQNRQELVPWFLYLRLFIFALSKLPLIKHRTIYRGLKMNLSEEFPEGKTFLWWGFSSTSSSVKALEHFLGHDGPRTIFNIECDSAKDISQHSFFPTENEVLIYPARQFQVTSSLNAGNQLTIIQIKETQPPFPLIHIPQTSSTPSYPIQDIQPDLSRIHNTHTPLPPTFQPTKEFQPSFSHIHHPQISLPTTHQSTKEFQSSFSHIHHPQISFPTTHQSTKEFQSSFSSLHIPQASSSNKYQNKNSQGLIEQCQSQSKVNLMDQNLDDEDMKIVVKEAIINKQCKELNLSRNKITTTGISIITKALNNNTTLEDLYLTGNHLSDIDVQSLTKILSLNNSKLSFLSVQNAGITDQGAEYIAQMLKTNTTLTRLILGNNKISDRGVDLLAIVLTYHNKTLKSISLASNKLVSDSCVDLLVQMFKHNQTLNTFLIHGCNLSENGKEKLRQITKLKKGFMLQV